MNEGRRGRREEVRERRAGKGKGDTYPGSVVGTTRRTEDKVITIGGVGVKDAVSVKSPAAALRDVGQRNSLVAELEVI